MSRYEVRLSGAGGQGMILAGIILAESTLDNDKLNVVQTQSYGPESRGGASRAEVVFSREPIDYPKVIEADLLVALTTEALEKYGDDIKDNAVVIADSDYIDFEYNPGKNISFYSIPIINTAIDEIGLKLTANMVALGAASHFISDLSVEDILNTINERVPAGTEEKNKEAFNAGRKLISEIKS
ncbi:MAG: 2-oxoacid:acceptor oxidoreductase family protein [Bacillota bacterium]